MLPLSLCYAKKIYVIYWHNVPKKIKDQTDICQINRKKHVTYLPIIKTFCRIHKSIIILIYIIYYVIEKIYETRFCTKSFLLKEIQDVTDMKLGTGSYQHLVDTHGTHQKIFF
ncbi:MAG: hypothetical protein CVU51_02840 [Deltaproteobacteria bacterium HGW-Deltaproteobacteria-1]|jgi:hypothetical protein|nr:MAG: hypothetical protein CVU51_02840 [Deltaproteobacteria bacterium HGW-Deltaproteobacteria-1]